MSLLPLIPIALQGAKTLYTMFNKPKKQDAGMLLDPIQRGISNMESDITSKTLMNKMTSGAKSLGSRMYQQSQRGLDVMKSRGELSEGQYASGLLQAGTDIQSKVGDVQSQAVMQQEQQNLLMRERVDQSRMRIAEIKEQYRRQNEANRQQWETEVAGGILDTAATGFNAIMSSIQDAQIKGSVTKYLQNKGVGSVGELDYDGLQGLLANLMLARFGLGG